MSRFDLPTPPQVPPHQLGTGTVRIRFEDLAQDGRVVLASIANSLSEAVWSSVFRVPWTQEGLKQGLVPILARAVLLGDGGPFAINADHHAEGRWVLGHTVDAAGIVNRLVLNMWVEMFGPRGLTYGEPPAGAGERLRAGSMYAEHVMTRLFADPSERKVLRLDIPSVEPVPSHRFEWASNEDVLRLPEGATALDADWAIESQPYVFGLVHTDVNQHVNSLVYPKVFEAACLRRFHALGLPTDVLARKSDMAFRKPSFATEALRIGLRAYRHGAKLGAVGIFFDEASGPSRPRTVIAMEFEA